MIQQQTITIRTSGRATIEITREVESIVRAATLTQGLCHLIVHHTSASLIITENADSNVRRDLETWIASQVRDGDAAFVHDQEGPDDMAAHIRSVLTQTEISIPIESGTLALGTWQGLFLWEHRLQPHRRRITVTLLGAKV
jgi:secondary thiamine-phosphate synthase enzyme